MAPLSPEAPATLEETKTFPLESLVDGPELMETSPPEPLDEASPAPILTLPPPVLPEPPSMLKAPPSALLESPEDMDILPPCNSLLPTDKLIPPADPFAEPPVSIEIVPLLPNDEDDPVATSMAPLSPEAPATLEETKTFPLESLVDGPELMETSPPEPLDEASPAPILTLPPPVLPEPPSMLKAPPSALLESPEDMDILPPCNSLLPTDKLIPPADPFAEPPVSIEIAPLFSSNDLVDPVAKTRVPLSPIASLELVPMYI